MTAVSYEQMVEYVSVTVARIESKIDGMAQQFRDHERYHRQLLTSEIDSVRSGRVAWWSVVVAGLSATAALVVAVVALSGRTG